MNEMIKEDNTKKLIIIICGFLLILIAIFLIVIGVINSQKEELLINKLESASLKTGCSTIKVEEMKNIVEYSFDNGKTWQKSNYNIICDNGNIKILGRDKNKKILAEGSIKIDDLYENYPKIKIDFDKIINTFDDNTLLKGITAHSNNQDVTEKIIIESKEYKDNKLIVTYSVTDENGNPQWAYALRYSEFIALNTRMIQIAREKINH